MVLATVFGPHRFPRDEMGRAIQPARENRPRLETRGLARQENEHGLRDFLGELWLADEAQGGAVNHAGVTFDKNAERFVRTALDMLLQE